MQSNNNNDDLLEYLKQIQEGSLEDFIFGCIFGQMIGDSLGSYLEFKQIVTVPELEQSLTMPGGGPFNLQAGQITDDTELAIGLIKGLNQMDPQQYDIEHIAKQYFSCYYLKIRFQSRPFDIGNTTCNALKYKYQNTKKHNEYQKQNALNYNTQSLSNGSLMRSSPFAVYAAVHKLDFQKLNEQLKQEVELTHSNPDAQNATIIWVYAIQQILLHHCETDEEKIKKQMINFKNQRVLELVKIQVQKINSPKINNFWDDVEINKIPPFNQNIGYLAIAWIAGFVQIKKTQTFKDVMEYVMKQGYFAKDFHYYILLSGDTDTNGCIIGAMHGAKLGFNNIYKENKNWIDTIMKCNPQKRMNYKPCILVEETIKLLEKYENKSKSLPSSNKNNMNEQENKQSL